MTRVISVSLALLCMLSAAAGQGNPPPKRSSSAVVLVPGSGQAESTCPVSLQARQGSGHGLLKVRTQAPTEPPSAPGQQIHLLLGGIFGGMAVLGKEVDKGVVKGRVSVRGLSSRGRVHPIVAGDGVPSGDLSRDLEVAFSREDGELSAELNLPGFTTVTSIRLESLTFADGNVWKADATTCTTVPDPLMLIESELAAPPAVPR